ncbi:MAG: putative heme-binding domain-containing protein [Kiritimatiellia bacterium]|jgi:putative heme-binding domain-containing protein
MESQMNISRITLLALLLPLTQAIGQSPLPPVEKSIEDPSTGLNVQPGFVAELIYTVDKKQYGTWISMAFDGQGRMAVSDQGAAGTFLLQIPKIGEAFDESKIQKLDVKSSQYGMLYAFDHLYMMGNSTLTRAKVLANGDLGPSEVISEMPGGGEHGPHSLVVTPDGKSLYAIAGNMTRIPEYQKTRIRENWKDDVLLQNYAYGHNGGGQAPGGWVLKLSPDGKEREVMNMGYRNPVDFALNRDGELFVYDADMEWDIGAPWYRPTRVNHGVSGGENGWRATSKKWRVYYPDTVGSVVDIGPGCPTGVIAGDTAKFPTHYRDALFICDWTFATMYSIHLKPHGSSYIGEKREFVSNTKGSLPLTDVVIGPDGHMYFCVGGRGGQSYLYRVSYQGTASTALSKLDTTSAHAKARAERHALEAFHGHPDAKAVSVAWPYLSSEDYHLRYAARIALEWQDPTSWADKAYAEKDDVAAIHALLGLARCDYEGSLAPSIQRLLKVDFKQLDKVGQLALLRTYAVIMSRGGQPDAAQVQAMGDQLDPHFLAKDDNVNEELCRVLSYLQHPSVVKKTIALMQTTKATVPDFDPEVMKRNGGYGGSILSSMESAPNILNIHYLFCLKDVQTGWTMDDRKVYLGELKTLLTKKGGNMFTGYIDKIRESAIASVPEKDKMALQYLMGDVKSIDLSTLPKAEGPAVAWTVESALKMLKDEPLTGRSLANGKKMFSAGLCVACHRYGPEGGGIGPDLTNLAKRSDYKSILESILEPNLVVSEQFEQHELSMKDGSTIMGRIVGDEDGEYALVQSGFEPLKLKKVKKSEVASKKGSKLSMMPPALINTMNAEELKDLVAYFVSEGNSRHPIYRSGKKLDIKLISAVYGEPGNPKKQMDVLKKIQSQLDAWKYDFEMSNTLAGKDPASGVVKVLELKYSYNGKVVSKKVKENGTVYFEE